MAIKSKVAPIDLASIDGQILSRTDALSSREFFTYLDMEGLGYGYASINASLFAYDLNFEACNFLCSQGEKITGTATSDGGVTTVLFCSTLSTEFPQDNDLVGIKLRVTNDTRADMLGAETYVTASVGATGQLFLSPALPQISLAGITSFELVDSDVPYSRRASDPSSFYWRDVTGYLFGVSTISVGTTLTQMSLIIDKPFPFSRLRIRQNPSNASNLIQLESARARV